MTIHPNIYKRDTTGKTRVWAQEIQGAEYRTIAGIQGGNLVTSGWTACVGKQGRSNYEQAEFEVSAAYKNKLTREYHETLEAISDGAHFFKPMLAQTYSGWPGICYAQPKLDGARCIATKDGLFSRQGKPFVSVPHIWQALSHLFRTHPDMVLDGELYNHDLKDDFGQIMSLVRQSKPTAEDLAKSADLIQYHIYDIPSASNFSERLDWMEFIVVEGAWLIKLVPTNRLDTPELADTIHAQYLALGYEGSIYRLDTPYEQKRSKGLLKRKEFVTDEFKVLAIEEGLGNWAGVAKKITCELPDGRTFGAGIKGTRERAAELLNETHSVATIRFFEYTPDGIPRFPVAIDFHGSERTL
jgi:DNA ligase-1